MHDLNVKNVSEDPVQIPDQVGEFVPLTPVQIFVKEEVIIPDHLEEVVPLAPVQIFIKEEVSYKTEEPVLVSLLPVLPKEESVVHALPDDFEDGSDALVINLDNSSSEEWSNHSDPLAIEPNEAEVSYAEYVENTDTVLLDLGATPMEGTPQTLRVTGEAMTTVENAELYDPAGDDRFVRGSENGSVSPEMDSDCEFADVSHVPAKWYGCGLCDMSFPSEGEMMTHTLSHVSPTAVWRKPPRVAAAKPKPVKTLRAQHACGDCGLSFDRLELLMRHRLGHIRTALRNPFGAAKKMAVPEPQPQTQVLATSDSRRTAVTTSSRATPKRNAQRSAITAQSKRWGRRKKTRRRGFLDC